MSENYVVGIDASEGSIRAAQYALAQAEKSGARLKVIHVLEWSPYSFLTTKELEERHKRRGEELERAKTAIIQPVLDKPGSDNVDGEVRYGQIAAVINNYCAETGAKQAFIGRHGGSEIGS